MTAQSVTEGYLALAALIMSGICLTALVGGFFWKKAPRFFCFSSSVGGYHSMGQGSPSKKSGMRTRCFSAARISAPWRVWGK
jgi:hypothetical protein